MEEGGICIFRMGYWAVLVLWLSWVTSLTGQNAPPNTVFYGCNNTFVSVSVKSDPLGSGKKLDPGSLTLGKCPVSSTSALYGFLVFEYHLSACGFSRMAYGNIVTYFVNLVYQPTNVGANLYSQAFTTQISCVLNISLTPTPTETKVVVPVYGKGQLNFFASLMTDDFSDTSSAKDFYLGSPISLQLSVDSTNHMPLRIFVDECIGTPTPDIINTGPSYSLITNHGCFVDGKVAASKFVEYLPLDTIRLTFPAMRFVEDSDQIYLHFKVVVWDTSTVTELRKACSYISNRWQLLGNSQSTVCNCCDSVCNKPSRKRRDAEKDPGLVYTMVLGPFKVHSPAVGGRENSAVNDSKVEKTKLGFPLSPVVGALFLELAVLMLLSIGVAVYDRTSKQKFEETEKRSLVTNEN